MIRWFRAQLEGSYVGKPGATKGPAGSRRYRLQVYRAALRDLTWLDPPSTNADASEPVPGVEPGTLWQSQIDHAHLAGVRGPGTWYEGPIFDVRIREVCLAHPTDSRGRAYGRISGSAVGWFELPPSAAHVLVPVEAPAAPELATPQGAVYVASGAAAEAQSGEGAQTARASTDGVSSDGAVQEATPDVGSTAAPSSASGALDGGMSLPSTVAPTRASSRRFPAHLPLSALVVALGLGLAITSGGVAVGLWTLFLVPTLVARRLFGEVLRESGALRGVGFGLIVLQIWCASSVVSQLLASGCATTAFLPALAVVLVLFPTGLLPTAWPLAFSVTSLAVVLAAFANLETTRCKGGTDSVRAAEAPRMYDCARVPACSAPAVRGAARVWRAWLPVRARPDDCA